MQHVNPAVELYQHWRSLIRYRLERRVVILHNDAKAELRSGSRINQIENFTTSIMYNSRNNTVPLNYRMGLQISGLSGRHLEPQLFDDTTNWEPIITLTCRSYGATTQIMSLYPNGSFMMHIHVLFPPMQDWTFWHRTYVVGQPAWSIISQGKRHAANAYFNGKDFRDRKPYLRDRDILRDNIYRLVQGVTGDWVVEDDSNNDNAVAKLRYGYGQAEARYDRYKRASERSTRTNRKALAIHVGGEGRKTGDEAVNHFVQSMRVYPPRPMKEAT